MSEADIRAGRGVIPMVDVIFTGVRWLAFAAIAAGLYLLGEGAYFVLTADSVEGTVFYHADDPEAARFATYVEFFDIPVVLGIAAAVLLGFRWFGYFVLGILGRAMLRATEGVADVGLSPDGEEP